MFLMIKKNRLFIGGSLDGQIKDVEGVVVVVFAGNQEVGDHDISCSSEVSFVEERYKAQTWCKSNFYIEVMVLEGTPDNVVAESLNVFPLGSPLWELLPRIKHDSSWRVPGPRY